MTDFVEPEVLFFEQRVVQDGKYVEGKDDWLFLGNDRHRVIDQHCGVRLLSEEELERWCDGLERRAAWMRERELPYVLTIVADKHAVYPEKLPPGIVPAPVRPVIQLLDALRTRKASVRVLYTLERVQKAKQTQQVYSATDTHWNAYGAWEGYEQIVDELEPLIPLRRMLRDNVRILERENAGDLGRKFRPERKSIHAVFAARQRASRMLLEKPREAVGRKIAFACSEAPDTTAVVFGDSATARLSTLLAETFGKVVLQYTSQIDTNLIVEEKADVVLSVLTERRLLDPRAIPKD